MMLNDVKKTFKYGWDTSIMLVDLTLNATLYRKVNAKKQKMFCNSGILQVGNVYIKRDTRRVNQINQIKQFYFNRIQTMCIIKVL